MIKIWYNHFLFDKWPCCNCQYTSRKSVFIFLKILQETIWLLCLDHQEKIHILNLPPLPCCKKCTINFIYTFAIYMILLYMYLWYVLIILYLYLNTYSLTTSVEYSWIYINCCLGFFTVSRLLIFTENKTIFLIRWTSSISPNCWLRIKKMKIYAEKNMKTKYEQKTDNNNCLSKRKQIVKK